MGVQVAKVCKTLAKVCTTHDIPPITFEVAGHTNSKSKQKRASKAHMKLSTLRANRPVYGWHGWFPALYTKVPTIVVGEDGTAARPSALLDTGGPKVKASYFDLVRDPKTGEITFWTKEDDTDGTPWKQVDKIRVGFEAWTVANKTSTNAQFNGYVSPMPQQQAPMDGQQQQQARMDAASDEEARLQL